MTWKIKVGRPCDEDGGKGNAKDNPDFKAHWTKSSRRPKVRWTDDVRKIPSKKRVLETGIRPSWTEKV